MDELADLIGESSAVAAVRDRLKRLLARQRGGQRLPSILIQGATGTGKGLVAHLLHRHGARGKGPFVDVNCAAIPDTLLEAELFGFERGAFTDARRAKPGLFQAAHGGVLFLDEVSLLPDSLQPKLLSALEERVVRRLGSTRAEPADAWLISATNTDLVAAVRAQRFREDLYHRLAVVTLDLPLLRERGRDILLLAKRFLARACAEYGLPAKRLDPGAEACLLTYAWPGNIRELANVIERAALFTDTLVVTADTLGPLQADSTSGTAARPLPETVLSRDDVTRQHLLAVLEQTRWNISHTAARLRIARNTVYAQMEKFGLRSDPLPRKTAARRLHPAEPGVTSSSTDTRLEWERRTIALLRVTLCSAEGADAWSQTGRALDAAIAKVHGFGGRIEDITPTGLVAAFGLDPVEDAPRRAAHAAMAIQKGARRAREVSEGVPGIRIGLHVAPLVIGLVGPRTEIHADAKSAAWGVLGQLLQRIEAGGTVASAAAAPFLERRFELVPLGTEDEELGPCYRLTGQERRGYGLWGATTRFVGRRDELEALCSRLDPARSGQGQIVAVVGEPGVGKSRLLHEFTHSHRVEGWLVIEGAATSHGTAMTYLPVVNLLKSYFKIQDRDDLRGVREKVTGKLLSLDLALGPCVAPILWLLDAPVEDPEWERLDPMLRRQRLHEAVRRLLLRESREQPLMVVFEDLHWIDSETQALLDGLVERLPAARVYLLVNYRPEYRHGWGGKTYYTQLRLDALPAASATELLGGLLGLDPSVAPLVPMLIAWTEGNPFFLEETVRALVEAKGLAGERGQYRLTQPIQEIQVPATVEAILAARIDRLPPEDKHVLQVASVVGKDVPFALLQAVAELPDESLRRGLDHLQAAEFLQETGLTPDIEYSFKHALTHEVAYSTLVGEHRRGLHAGLVAAIERIYAGRLDEQVERLAVHASLGGMGEAAVRYFQQAAVRARARFAYHQHARFVEQALAQAAGLADGEPRNLTIRDLLGEMAGSFIVLGKPDRAVESYRRVLALAEESADENAIAGAASGLAFSHVMSGCGREAIPCAERAIAILAPSGPTHEGSRALYCLGRAHQTLGNFARARQAFESVISLYETGALPEGTFATGTFSSVTARALLVGCLVLQGEFGEAARVHEGLQRLLALPALQADPNLVLFSHWSEGRIALEQGEFERADGVYNSMLSLRREWQHDSWQVPITADAGRAAMFCGRLDEGVRLLEEARQLASLFPIGQALRAVWLADAYACTGRVADARRAADEALAHAQARGERPSEAYALRTLAELDGRAGVAGEAQATAGYRDALALATELGMRPLAAHCHLGCGKLCRHTGQRERAREHFVTAAAMYREMDMRFWPNQAEKELRDSA